MLQTWSEHEGWVAKGHVTGPRSDKSNSLLKSFQRTSIENWNLSFCFQCYLFILKSVIEKILLLRISFYLFIDWFNLIYELDAVVSIHSDVFYPATSTLKMLHANFFWTRFVTIWLFCKFFIHVFLKNFLTYYNFPLRYVFSIH